MKRWFLIFLTSIAFVGTPNLAQADVSGLTPCKDSAVHITQKSGGDGAFREAVEWILSEQGRLDSIISDLKQNIQNQ